MDSQTQTLVIYHGNCADGFGAAYAAWKIFGTRAEYYPAKYQQEPPDVTNKAVYILDFSYKKPVMEQMLEKADYITIIDHHASAIEDLQSLEHSRFYKVLYNTNSGAHLAWKYFHGTNPPDLIKHIEDRDLWKFEFAKTRDIQTALFSLDWTFELWDEIVKGGQERLDELAIEGVALNRKHFKDLKILIEIGTRTMDIAGYEVPVASMPPMMTSDAGHIMAKDQPFAACYYDTPHYRNFSLRSEANGLDVSKIAAIYGGGGHPRASGFKVPRDHELAKA